MPLSWNEIKSRAMAFARAWGDAAHERQQSIPFWIDFFGVFGLSNHESRVLPGSMAGSGR